MLNLFFSICHLGEILTDFFHLISVPVVRITDTAGRYKIPDKSSAASTCGSKGMWLATREQLEDARLKGLDVCSCGWLADGTAAYPILKPRDGCEPGAPAGLRTCSSTPVGAGWDAYCTETECKCINN